ncbi:hypothetical protein F3Y22_tig00116954pilonHSYRG00032 [Hibiscus syriacus]|uniref:RNase H type-1 domain-containing protein n=1 Tax=Hibiscus syriacus TaxID=106335 RepID=A0A6A2WKP7_HIBSY|nr:hypothetical protein F3Y22_tig00116954pilonHSYRG00032 [Hibiscus syriacus]
MQVAYNPSNFPSPTNGSLTLSRDHSNRWAKPPPDFLKLNVDGALLKKYCRCSLSPRCWFFGCWSYSEGFVVAASAGCIASPHDAGFVEAQALCFGLRFVSEMGYSQVMIESDAINVVNQLLNHHSDNFILRFTLSEARRILDFNPSISIRSIHRSANGAAHVLAIFKLYGPVLERETKGTMMKSNSMWDPIRPTLFIRSYFLALLI